MLGGWGWRLLVLHVLLGGGCVSQAMYQAKVDELERLRADGRRGEQLLVERIDRMSARIGDLEKQFVQSDTRLMELSRSMQQVRDLAVQLDQRLTVLGNRELRNDSSSRDAHRPEPGIGLRDPFARPK